MATDNDIMIRVSEGETDKLGILFERYKKRLLNFFLMSTGNRQASEDLVQDVFTRILQYRRTYRNGGDFAVWMYGIARNARIDHFRGNNVRTVSFDESFDVENGEPPQDETYERSVEIDILRRSLSKLDEGMRELIILSRYNKLRYREIGEILGIGEGAVKVRMYRALKELAGIYHTMEGGKRHEL